MPAQQYMVKLADKIVLNEKYVHYFFELVEPNVLQFEAGQYVSLKVDPAGDRRSYSIVSDPTKQHGFELMVDLTPNGKGVQFLQGMKFGDEAHVLAPLGMFTIKPEEVGEAPLVMIATGSGIAPFRSMILDQLLVKKVTKPIILYWGLRQVENLFWQEEMAELQQTYSNFQFHPVLSQAGPEWPLCHGRVTDCLRVHELWPTAHYFLCGNQNMILEMLPYLTQRGIPQTALHHEKFF